jgi:hypothetical protein
MSQLNSANCFGARLGRYFLNLRVSSRVYRAIETNSLVYPGLRWRQHGWVAEISRPHFAVGGSIGDGHDNGIIVSCGGWRGLNRDAAIDRQGLVVARSGTTDCICTDGIAPNRCTAAVAI